MPEQDKLNLSASSESVAKMVDWFKSYIDDPKWITKYADQETLEIVAEATFCSVKLGLAPLFEKMSYQEIISLKPLEEKNKALKKLMEAVEKELTIPTRSYVISFALRNAALAIYVKKHTYAFVLQQQVDQNQLQQVEQQPSAHRVKRKG